MNLPKNYRFSYFKARISSSIPLRFSYYELKKPVENISDTYKLTLGENSLIQYSKTSTTRKASILAVRLRIYIKKMV